MKSKTTRFLWSLLCLCCLSLAGRAQVAMNIYGDTAVCAGASYQYECFPTVYPPNPSVVIGYLTWTVIRGNIALHTNDNQKTILWGAPGTGTIVVAVYDTANVLLKKDTLEVNIKPLPAPGIQVPQWTGCQPLNDPGELSTPDEFWDPPCTPVCGSNIATYTATGGAASTYDWTAIGGNIFNQSGNTCDVEWTVAGPGKLTVKETTLEGCTGETSICVKILGSGLAHFVALPDTNARNIIVCGGGEVVFIDKSFSDPDDPIVYWRWDFGDGTFSNAKGGKFASLTHKFPAPGNYTVILTVTNQCGCSTTETMDVQVLSDPPVEIVCPGVVCENASYTYNVASGCSGGTWQVFGGSISGQTSNSITVTWNNLGTDDNYGYITYDPTGAINCNFCTQPVATRIPVVRTTATIDGPDFLCVAQQYLYRLPQWPTTRYTWTVNNTAVSIKPTDQPNEIVLVPTPSAAGSVVTLTCNYNNTLLGCSGTATKQISVPGDAVITDTVFDFCEGVETIFHLAGPNINTAEWTLLKPDNSTVTHGPNSTFPIVLDVVGSYLLSVTGDFCAPDPIELRVIGIPEAPDYISGEDRICKGIPEEYLAGIIDADHIFAWSISNATLNASVGEATEVILNTTAAYPFTLNAYRETKAKPYCRSLPASKEILPPVVVFSVYGEDTVCPSFAYNYGATYEQGEEYAWSVYPHTMGSVDNGQGTSQVKILWNSQPGAAKVVCRIAKCYSEYSYDTFDVYVRPLTLSLTLSGDTICMGATGSATVSVGTHNTYWFNGSQHLVTGAGTNSIPIGFYDPIQTYTTYYLNARVDSPYGCPTPVYAEDSIVVIPAPWITVTPPTLVKKCDAALNETLTVSYDPNGMTPSGYEWRENGVLSGTGTTYGVTDSGKYKVTAMGTFGCGTTVAVNVPYKCDTGAVPCCGTPDASKPECNGKYAWLVAQQHGCSGADSITVRRYVSSPSTFVGGTWRAHTDSLELVRFTDSTATYIPKYAGVYRIWYNASFYSGVSWGGNCVSTPDTLVTVRFVPRLEVKALCYEHNDNRYLEYIDRSTALSPIIYRKYLQKDRIYPQYIGVDSGNHGSFITPNLSPPYNRTLYFVLVVGTATDTCTDTVRLGSFYPLPKANFTTSLNPACVQDAAVFFTNKSVPPPGNENTFLWNFKDGAKNTKANAYRVFNDPGNYPVSLTHTDRWGCVDSTRDTVMVVPDQLDGEVTITPPFPCEGTSASAEYSDAGLYIATSFTWYDKKASLIGSGSNPWDVYRSGYYYAQVDDIYGCKLSAQGDTVTFIKVPRAIVRGDQHQCRDVPFTLSGYVGQVPGLVYRWERDGNVIPGATGAELEQTITTADTILYRVTVIVPKPDGTDSCSDVSDLLEVFIHGTPDDPAVSFSVLDCDDYTLQLDVSPTYGGTYNWNNGEVGTSVQVHQGGPYQVIHTDDHGCVSKTRLQTPQDLRVYLWMFPTGCYSLCATDANIITGPIIPFKQWDYLHNGTSFAGSMGQFWDVSLNGTRSGYYEMYLENDWCDVTSDTMEVDYQCTPGGPGTRGVAPKYGSGIRDLVSSPPLLTLVPNPAQHNTRVSYRYPDGHAPAFIEVYDVLGRVIYGTQLRETEGSVDIGLQHFSPGTYRIILRQGGAILQHGQLSVTR